MEPPQPEAQRTGSSSAQGQRPQALGNDCAHRGPPARVPHVRPRLQPHQPRRLEQVAREADDQQDPQKCPVFAPVLRPVEIRIAGRAVRPRVVELRRLEPAASIHHVGEAADERDPGEIENQREDQIELAVPEANSEQRLEDVVFQSDRRGAEKQQQEAVEDQPMRTACRRIAALDGAVVEHRRDHVGEPSSRDCPSSRSGAPRRYLRICTYTP